MYKINEELEWLERDSTLNEEEKLNDKFIVAILKYDMDNDEDINPNNIYAGVVVDDKLISTIVTDSKVSFVNIPVEYISKYLVIETNTQEQIEFPLKTSGRKPLEKIAKGDEKFKTIEDKLKEVIKKSTIDDKDGSKKPAFPNYPHYPKYPNYPGFYEYGRDNKHLLNNKKQNNNFLSVLDDLIVSFSDTNNPLKQ